MTRSDVSVVPSSTTRRRTCRPSESPSISACSPSARNPVRHGDPTSHSTNIRPPAPAASDRDDLSRRRLLGRPRRSPCPLCLTKACDLATAAPPLARGRRRGIEQPLRQRRQRQGGARTLARVDQGEPRQHDRRRSARGHWRRRVGRRRPPARAIGFQGFGFYPRSGFIHIDLGRRAAGASAFRSAGPLSLSRRRRCARCWRKVAHPDLPGGAASRRPLPRGHGRHRPRAPGKGIRLHGLRRLDTRVRIKLEFPILLFRASTRRFDCCCT